LEWNSLAEVSRGIIGKRNFVRTEIFPSEAENLKERVRNVRIKTLDHNPLRLHGMAKVRWDFSRSARDSMRDRVRKVAG